MYIAHNKHEMRSE